MKKLILSTALLAVSTPVLAHPGHEAARELGPLHWFTEADHLVVISGALAVVLAFGIRRFRARQG